MHQLIMLRLTELIFCNFIHLSKCHSSMEFVTTKNVVRDNFSVMVTRCIGHTFAMLYLGML